MECFHLCPLLLEKGFGCFRVVLDTYIFNDFLNNFFHLLSTDALVHAIFLLHLYLLSEEILILFSELLVLCFEPGRNLCLLFEIS